MADPTQEQAARIEAAKKSRGEQYDFRVVDAMDFNNIPRLSVPDLTEGKKGPKR